jgi:hypothetical protein
MKKRFIFFVLIFLSMNLSNLESADVDMKVINEGDFQSCLIQSNLMKDETAVLLAYLYYCIER